MSFLSTKPLSHLSAALAVSLSVAACSHSSNASVETPHVISDHGVLRVPEKSPLRAELMVQAVEMREMPHAMTFPAQVEVDPAHQANVLPSLTGKVVELKVGLGDHVARGQLLAVIDSGDLAQAYADVDKASDALDLAKKSLERARGVQQAGGSAVKDLQAAQSGYNQALAEFARAQTRLAAVGGAAGSHGAARAMNVTAPASGYVTALSISPGMYVNDPNAPMLSVANLDTLWITANVPEGDVGQVAKGQQVDATLSAYPDKVLHGQRAVRQPGAGCGLPPQQAAHRLRQPGRAQAQYVRQCLVRCRRRPRCACRVGAADEQRQDQRIRRSDAVDFRAPHRRTR